MPILGDSAVAIVQGHDPALAEYVARTAHLEREVAILTEVLATHAILIADIQRPWWQRWRWLDYLLRSLRSWLT